MYKLLKGKHPFFKEDCTKIQIIDKMTSFNSLKQIGRLEPIA